MSQQSRNQTRNYKLHMTRNPLLQPLMKLAVPLEPFATPERHVHSCVTAVIRPHKNPLSSLTQRAHDPIHISASQPPPSDSFPLTRKGSLLCPTRCLTSP